VYRADETNFCELFRRLWRGRLFRVLSSAMKKVLMLAYYFAPRNHIASIRAGCFAKFLPENGWLPTVVCDYWGPEKTDYNPDIIGKLSEQIEVHQVKAKRPSGLCAHIISRKLGPYLWPAKSPAEWYQLALQKTKELLNREQFDAIWATSDPLVPLAVGCEVSRVTGIPLIADIRDSYNAQPFGPWYRRPINKRAEHLLCARASKVVTVSRGLAEKLQSLLKAKVEVIENGYDPEMITTISSSNKADTFTLLYTGTILPDQQVLRPLFDALSICVDENSIPSNEVVVKFVGSRIEDVRRGIPENCINRFVELADRTSHNEVLKMQRAAAALVSFTHPKTAGTLTGKIFDYLAAGRPIIAIPEDHGAIGDLLRETGAGVCLSDPEAIAQTLTKWYNFWRTNRNFTLLTNTDAVAKYSRKEQAKKLAVLLAEAAHSPGIGSIRD